MDLFILLVSSISIALLGLLVLARNASQWDNRRFACVAFSLASWITFNYLSDNATTNNLLYTRLTFLTSVFAVVSFIWFFANFPTKLKHGEKKLLTFHVVLTAILLPITLSPWFVVGVGDIKGSTIHTGFLYPLFIVYVVYSILVLILIAWRQSLNATTRSQRQQVLLLFIGIAGYAILTFVFSILLPAIAGDWSTSRFAPLFTLIFVGLVSYAVAKKRLFDIKTVVFRSLGYVLSLILIGVVSFFVLRQLSILMDRANIAATIQTNVFVIITLILAICYQPVKLFFDQLTRRFFYRDAYDTRDLLDEFNQVIASTLTLDDLLPKAAKTVEKFIKAEFVTFLLRKDNGDYTVLPIHKMPDDMRDKLTVVMKHQESGDNVFIADELGENQVNLKKLLRAMNIGAIARIEGTSAGHDVHYLVLGYKKSGNTYSLQDQSAIKVLANGSAVAIQNALRFEEIENFNNTLQQKIDEKTKSLQLANQKLRQLDETKDDFISMASHQLRTPLTSIKGYISMVLDGDAGKISPMERKLLGQAFISSQRMVYLISDLLNVSRLRTGKFIIEPMPTNLSSIISEEVKQLQETAKGRGLELTFDKPTTFDTYMLDETKMRQVIMNFIDNAIYYTPSGGKIEVKLLNKPESIEFTVTDTGIGVPKSEQHKLFTKFYRAHNAKRARPDGTGLGLFMAKKVIVAQGGAVLVKSQEGKGSTFGFTFAKSKLEQVPTKGN